MRLLALDVGDRETGVAYFDDSVGFAYPLDSIVAEGEALAAAVLALAQTRRAERLIVGLPRLPGGEEGEQARSVRTLASTLEAAGIPVRFIDERYTTARHSPGNPHAQAAVSLLNMAIERGIDNN